MHKKAIFMISALLLISACAQNSDKQEKYDHNYLRTENYNPINAPTNDDALHIVLFGRAYNNIELFITYFNEHISDINIVVERLDTENVGSYSEQLRTGLLSGNAPDIINIRSDLDYDLSNSPYLVDLMVFIENDPEFNMENYYGNVVNALKINERLPYIPTSFDMEFVGINGNCTELLTDFNNLETASYKQLIDIYKSMPPSYAYDFCAQFYALDVVYSSDFIDFRNRTALYNSQEFIDRLEEALQINNSFLSAATSNYSPEYGDTHLFHAVNYMERRVFMPYKEPYIHFNSDPIIGNPVNVPSEFINFKPLTNNKGELSFYSITLPLLAITESSLNKESAWEFIKLLLSEESYNIFNDENSFYQTNSHQIYLNKTVDQKMSQDYFMGYIREELGIDALPDEILMDIENTVHKLQGYASLPMVYERSYPAKLSADINSVIELLISGQISTEQAAQQLHNMTELAFLE